MATATTATETTGSRAKLPKVTLDELTHMTVEELTGLYRRGRLPDSMTALDGTPHGRMLAVVGPAGRGAPADALRRFAASEAFPWRGKSFTATGDQTGVGINRVKLAGEYSWFPFDTRIDASAIDGEDCIFLDYDKPENPWFIRQIRDELREVSPGLFLGPAMWKTKSVPRVVLFFAIDTTR